jgi:DUF1680 family protein
MAIDVALRGGFLGDWLQLNRAATKYLALASRMIERRGHAQLGGSEYLRDHAPVREATQAVGHVARVAPPAGDVLYAEYAPPSLATAEARLTAIPDFRWANRGPGPMRVWIPI